MLYNQIIVKHKMYVVKISSNIIGIDNKYLDD